MRLFILAVLIVLTAAGAFAGDIHQAVQEGDLKTLEALLTEDPGLVEAKAASQFEDLPLHVAAREGQVKAAKMLLKAGADVDGGDIDDSTPLGVAALSGQPEMVDLLLKAGADVNLRDRNGAVPLSFAVSGGNEEIVRVLLAAGAERDWQSEDGTTMLHYAATRGMTWLCDDLLAAGADIDARDKRQQTPLHLMGWSTHPEMVAYLVENGATVDARDEQGGTPLMRACWSRERGLPVAEALLVAGADPSLSDKNGGTPLFAAAWQGNADLVAVLLKHGADPNVPGENGQTALMRASCGGHTEAVTALLAAGACPKAVETTCGRTALHAAAACGYGDVAKMLVKAGAPLDVKDNQGATPLKLAAWHGNADVTAVLASADGAPEEKIAKIQKKACQAGHLGGQKPCAEGEAVTWYLGHSGWAVATSDHILVFDYWHNEREPDQPCLGNGCICPKEMAGKKVVVFASHSHRDHYDPAIFEWRDKPGADVTYVLGFEAEDATGYEFMPPRETRTIAGCEITTLKSNDSGVGWVVAVDGVTVFHAGDHANRHQDFSGPYKEEIDWLAQAGVKPDIAFMPISGCGFGDQEAVRLGVEYALETLQPQVFCPMHSAGNPQRYHDFVGQCQDRFPAVTMQAVRDRGDRFRYADGGAL